VYLRWPVWILVTHIRSAESENHFLDVYLRVIDDDNTHHWPVCA